MLILDKLFIWKLYVDYQGKRQKEDTYQHHFHWWLWLEWCKLFLFPFCNFPTLWIHYSVISLLFNFSSLDTKVYSGYDAYLESLSRLSRKKMKRRHLPTPFLLVTLTWMVQDGSVPFLTLATTRAALPSSLLCLLRFFLTLLSPVKILMVRNRRAKNGIKTVVSVQTQLTYPIM